MYRTTFGRISLEGLSNCNTIIVSFIDENRDEIAIVTSEFEKYTFVL